MHDFRMPLRLLIQFGIFSMFMLGVLVLISSGCDWGTQLEKRTSQIKSGMTVEEVKVLFDGFDARPDPSPCFVGKLQNTKDYESRTVVLQTNAFVSSKISFWPVSKGFFDPFEVCYIYFDTNNIVVGYHYSIDH